MYFFVGIAFAIPIFCIFVWLVAKRETSRLKHEAKALLTERAQSVVVSQATVADDLFPATKSLELKGATISVVGGDGSYINLPNGEELRRGLEDWCERGANVRYLLTCASEKAIAAFDKLDEELGSKFTVTYVDCLDKHEELEITHPTLIELSGDRRAMWLESDHPRNSMVAYGVKYTSPSAMYCEPESQRQFEKYIGNFEELVNIAA